MELKILELVKAKHKQSGGNNGSGFGDFDHILQMSLEDRNAFLQRMADEKKIQIRDGANAKMIMMPK
nr:hypothetical protein [uncultured Chryseobacterium sp.]